MSFIRRTQGREERKEAGKKGRLENKNFHSIARWRKEKKRLDPVDVGNGRYLQKSFGRHRQVSAGAKWQAAWEMERKSKSRRLIRSNRIRADGSRGDFGASRPSHSLNKLLGVQVNSCSLSHQTSQKIQMKEEKKRENSQSIKKDWQVGVLTSQRKIRWNSVQSPEASVKRKLTEGQKKNGSVYC